MSYFYLFFLAVKTAFINSSSVISPYGKNIYPLAIDISNPLCSKNHVLYLRLPTYDMYI